ncbi:MAG: 3-deoxy-manno-octulosonate-8-phosphatase KdsC [Xanthomonadales bacterium]|nr:3-deoxy-manno-octulosonate-8-phosphatase KdsC [Xanthomonadales bacterium]
MSVSINGSVSIKGSVTLNGSVYLKDVPTAVVEKAQQVRLLALDVDGVMTDGRLYFDQAGQEMKAFSTRDGMGIKALQRCGIQVALITGRQSPMVSQRARELGIELVFQGSNNKAQALQALLAATGLGAEQVCYAGDDWIDLPVLSLVGFSVTVADADPLIRQNVDWVTTEAGGMGAVRALCNLILAAQGQIDQLMQEYSPA